MYSIVIDTSSTPSYIALVQDKMPIKQLFLMGRDQTQTLLPSLISLLKEHQLTLPDLSFIAVATGPGTFTGTRVGLISAKSLAYAGKIPLIDFPSTPEREKTEEAAKKSLDLIIDYLLQRQKEGSYCDPQSLDATYTTLLPPS